MRSNIVKTRVKSEGLTRRDFLASSTGLVAGGVFGILPEALAYAASRPMLDYQAGTAGSPRRVIIDTDPGVDDAIAILLALRSPELKVEAITAVAGNVPLEVTLPNALRLVEIAGRTDIPVAGGAEAPLIRRLITASRAHGENGFGGVEFPEPKTAPVKETASELICRIVQANPGEVSIIGLGPLTNIALALRAAPNLSKMIKSFALMGGSLSGGNVTPAAEFNFYVDPEATRVVFHSGVPISMVGLDVTRRTHLREEHIAALEAGSNASSIAAGRILRASMNRLRKRAGSTGEGIAMHDSLAASVLIDPEILTMQDYFVEIETMGEVTAGETVGYRTFPFLRSAPLETGMTPRFGENKEKPAEAAGGSVAAQEFHPNAQVALEVDTERFFKLVVGRLTGSGH